MRRWVAVLTATCGALAAFPSFTSASIPPAGTAAVISTSATTATLTGSVWPAGLPTTYEVEYDLASSTWCTSAGWSLSAAHTTPAQSLPFTDQLNHTVSVSLSGLTPGARYCAALYADNSSGQAGVGETPVVFTAGAPSVGTSDSTSTGAGSAQVTGTVNPAGQATGTLVEYDLDTSLWCQTEGRFGTPAHATTPQPLGYSDTASHAVTLVVSGLTVGTAYCAEIVASDPSGSASGATVFMSSVTSGPAVGLGTATPSGPSSEVLNGYVDPEGQSGGSASFLYDVQGSPWCASGGLSGSAAHSISAAYVSSVNGDQKLTATAGGLTDGATYCWALSASVGGTSAQTRLGSFAAGLPTAATGIASVSAGTGAGLGGRVTDNGNPTVWRFDYGLEASSWCQSDGVLGSPLAATHTELLLGSGAGSSWIISTSVDGLSPSTSYCFRIVAMNKAGTANGDTVLFTTPAALPLTVSVTGMGLVNGINLECATTCSTSYFQGVQVRVSAIPLSGAHFLGWGGACSGTGDCLVRMNSAQRVTAAFSVPPRCRLRALRGGARATLKVRLSCDQTATLRLTGAVVRMRPPGRSFKLRPRRLMIRGGRPITLEMRIPRRALVGAPAHSAQTVLLTLVATNGNGRSQATAEIKLPRPH